MIIMKHSTKEDDIEMDTGGDINDDEEYFDDSDVDQTYFPVKWQRRLRKNC